MGQKTIGYFKDGEIISNLQNKHSTKRTKERLVLIEEENRQIIKFIDDFENNGVKNKKKH